MAEARIEFRGRDDQANRVRPENAQEVGLGRVEHGLPQAIGAGEARGNDNGRAAALLSEFGDKAGHGGRGRGDHCKLRRRRKIGDGAVAPPAFDLVILRVDRPDVSLEAAVNEIAEHGVTDRTLSRRCTEHSDGFGMNSVFKVTDGHSSFSEMLQSCPFPPAGHWREACPQ